MRWSFKLAAVVAPMLCFAVTLGSPTTGSAAAPFSSTEELPVSEPGIDPDDVVAPDGSTIDYDAPAEDPNAINEDPDGPQVAEAAVPYWVRRAPRVRFPPGQRS